MNIFVHFSSIRLIIIKVLVSATPHASHRQPAERSYENLPLGISKLMYRDFLQISPRAVILPSLPEAMLVLLDFHLTLLLLLSPVTVAFPENVVFEVSPTLEKGFLLFPEQS